MWEGTAVDSRTVFSRIRIPAWVALPLTVVAVGAAIVNGYVWPLVPESWTYPFNVFLVPLGFLVAFTGGRDPDDAEENAPTDT